MNYLKLIISIISCELVGILGAFFTTKNIPIWFEGLKKPSFNPPNWIFGPVWFILYFIMGISFYLIWNKSGEVNIKIPVLFFILQLIFNFFWSVIFFGLKMPGLAFIDILVLSALILICIIVFYSISNTASYLLIPYFLWVCFASLLNYKIWTLNF